MTEYNLKIVDVPSRLWPVAINIAEKYKSQLLEDTKEGYYNSVIFTIGDDYSKAFSVYKTKTMIVVRWSGFDND